VQHQFLRDNQVDLWFVLSHWMADLRLLDEYRSFLPSDEAAQETKFAFEESRIQHLVSRVLLRTVLSSYTGHDPRAWVFTRSAHGKPAIAAPSGLPLEFNLSHTRGLVCCAIATGRPVGVDTEELTGIVHSLELAKGFFAPTERALIENTSAAERSNVFARIWTLKEAFAKACGLGFSLPLDEYAFQLSKDRPPVIAISDKHHLEPSNWQFAEVELASRYQISLAIELPIARRLAVRVRPIVPLRRTSKEWIFPTSRSNAWRIEEMARG